MPSSVKYFASLILLASRLIFSLQSLAEPLPNQESNDTHWFENFKKNASDKQLYQFLYNMPKGADLHHHASGTGFPRWWYELATNSKLNGGYSY